MPSRSFIDYPENCDFPIQNLPYGVFSTEENDEHRIGVAIGDLILDLKSTKNVFNDELLTKAFQQNSLNDFMSLSHNEWKEARKCLQSYLSAENGDNFKTSVFVKQSDAFMHVPVEIGDYSDFFSSLYHARNCSKMFGKQIFGDNWKSIPIAYHGRSSTIVISGTPIKRPRGQLVRPDSKLPIFSPTKYLDYELEMGVFLGGPLNKLGEPLLIDDIEKYIFGFVLVNDWSARDVQSWESVPLGPFLSKSFATSISPWIVTTEALLPFIVENSEQVPAPLTYLQHKDNYNFNINLEAFIKNDDFLSKICTTNFRYLYWTVKQQLCHHASNGCKMRPGDLLGSGTISGPTDDSLACLLESTLSGTRSIKLSAGVERMWLEDGDQLILTGYSQGDGYRIGFGSCTGKILPSDS